VSGHQLWALTQVQHCRGVSLPSGMRPGAPRFFLMPLDLAMWGGLARASAASTFHPGNLSYIDSLSQFCVKGRSTWPRARQPTREEWVSVVASRAVGKAPRQAVRLTGSRATLEGSRHLHDARAPHARWWFALLWQAPAWFHGSGHVARSSQRLSWANTPGQCTVKVHGARVVGRLRTCSSFAQPTHRTRESPDCHQGASTWL